MLKFNKARIKMRKSLGMDLNTTTEDAIKKFWTLGDYLNEGKIKEQELHPDIIKRKKLLQKYQDKVREFKSKVDQDKENILYDKIYISPARKIELKKLIRKKS